MLRAVVVAVWASGVTVQRRVSEKAVYLIRLLFVNGTLFV